MPAIRVTLAATVVAGAVACSPAVEGSDGGTGTDATAGGDDGGGVVWDGAVDLGATWACNVDPIVRARCQTCHANPPLFGAPMPLLTWNDTQAQGVLTPSKKVYQLMAERVADPRKAMPPPPNPRLADSEIGTIRGWSEAGAPQGSAANCASDAGVADGGSAGNDGGFSGGACPAGTQEFNVVAPNFQIPMSADHYQCFSQTVTLPAKRHAIRLDRIVDDARVVHHIILFKDVNGGSPASMPGCGIQQDWQMLYGWAPGTGAFDMPADVGLPVNDRDQLIIQIHYNNPLGVTGQDSSGAKMCLTANLRPKEASVLGMGPFNFTLPQCTGGQRATVYGDCRNILGTAYQIFSTSPHMHQRGRALKTWFTNKSGILVDRQNFDFNNQYIEPASVTFAPNDTLRTKCWFDTSLGGASFGERTSDEMCFNFVYITPPISYTFCPSLGTGICE